MSNNFKISTLQPSAKQNSFHKGLVFHAPLTNKFLQNDSGLLASDVSVKHNHADSVIGTPTYSSSGVDFNDAVTNLCFPSLNVFNFPTTTIAFRFTPDFVANDNLYHYLFDSDTPNRTYILKYSSAINNQLSISLYGTLIVSVPIETYEPYWNRNRENVFIITTNDSSNLTNVWLNSVQIVLDHSTAFTSGDVSSFSLGGKFLDGSTPFDGEIRDFRIWSRILSDSERQIYEQASGITTLRMGN